MNEKQLLHNAANEIMRIRRENQILVAKVEVIDVFAAALGMRRDGGLMMEDIVFQIQDHLRADTGTSSGQ